LPDGISQEDIELFFRPGAGDVGVVELVEEEFRFPLPVDAFKGTGDVGG